MVSFCINNIFLAKLAFVNSGANPVSLNNSVEFYSMEGDNQTLVTALTISPVTTIINSYAYCGFDQLTTLNIPTSVVNISAYAFDNSDNILTINYDGSQGQWDLIQKGANNLPQTNAVKNYLG